MNRLIINADDFGIHHEVNLAVAKAFDQGVLTSTSLLASGPAFNRSLGCSPARSGYRCTFMPRRQLVACLSAQRSTVPRRRAGPFSGKLWRIHETRVQRTH